ncbi:LacI family DNA-binding transcriptional regulator [Rhodophyticola sp. CCM32]|uniref:LacI family DNA-binding transcriptional regulator n=1 Tax=Rhodophyticola sp. CCM32 TaxID=2916397 RepID=UPI00107F3E24|nr:substrate-binding domain-containing protein [Rhodophyticola sp. CCM32]QBY00006.1 LacI family DNA-binding transcriptional regulator [Rhodophyticola sp. CCM32]
MRKRPTILDVADHAGVSKSTVSLVLQRSPLVKAETADLVRNSMAALGYVYNRAAAQLRAGGVGLIGMVINDLRNPFFTEFATSVQMSLSARGYATIISNSNEDAELQAQVAGSMIEHGVSGLIISPAYGATDALFDRIAQAGLPCLQMLRRVDMRTDLFPFASFDYAAGGAEATRALLASGARNIAFVGGVADRAITRERLSGYLHEMQAAGRDPVVFHGRASRSFGRQTALHLARDHPGIDAAICFNDLVALGLHSGFAEIGRRVGTDFQLIGFDDIEECAQVYPQLSSVSCDIESFGAYAAKLMLDWLENNKRPEAEYRAAVQLVPRASSKKAPI